MSALRIREAAEQTGWSTPEQTWLRTWPASKGSMPTWIDFKGRGSFLSIPEVSFQVERTLLLTDFDLSPSPNTSFIWLVNLRKITKDAHLSSSFITSGNQPVQGEQEFPQNSCLGSPFPVESPVLFSATRVEWVSLLHSGAENQQAHLATEL